VKRVFAMMEKEIQRLLKEETRKLWREQNEKDKIYREGKRFIERIQQRLRELKKRGLIWGMHIKAKSSPVEVIILPHGVEYHLQGEVQKFAMTPMEEWKVIETLAQMKDDLQIFLRHH